MTRRQTPKKSGFGCMGVKDGRFNLTKCLADVEKSLEVAIWIQMTNEFRHLAHADFV
ncbi:MAG: hypothetical protein AAF636_11970 [Pseudomonadota bacterium]